MAVSLKRLINKWRDRRDIRHHLAANDGNFSFDGLKLTVPRTVFASVRHLLAKGGYESEEIDFASRYVAPQLPAIELGGCIGVVSAKLRTVLSSDVSLIIVEANPKLTEILRANAMRPDPTAPTEVICAAVHYGADVARFRVHRNPHVSRLAGPGIRGRSRVMPATTLSTLVSRLPADSEYSLVCDIEGGEFDIFDKDQAALARCKMAIVETHPPVYARCGRTLKDFLALAENAGFTVAERKADVFVLVRGA